MTDNLQEMLDTLNTTPSSDAETEDFAIESAIKDPTEVVAEVAAEVVPEVKKIGITNLYDWYEQHLSDISTVGRVRTEVSEVNSKDSIIFKVPKGKSDTEKELISFYNPLSQPILNLPPVGEMRIFKNNTFVVIHNYNDSIFIKSYGVKTGLILVFCILVENQLVPFNKMKVKKKVADIEIVEMNPEEIKERLSTPVDMETVQLLYSQIIKHSSNITTRQELLTWFLEKIDDVIDINHLIKIDNVLIKVI